MSRRGVIRLLVASPDGRHVLARPNGLAGWALPTVAVDLPFERWDEVTARRAGDVLGAPVVPGDAVVAGDPAGPAAWSVKPTARVPAVGRTWIRVDEADRLGADAAVVRSWASAQDHPGRDQAHGPAHRGDPPG